MLFRNEKRSGTSSTAIDITDQRLLDWLGIDPGGISVRGKNALKQATVFACIDRLSKTVAKLPLKIYKDGDHGIKKATNHYLYNLLKLRPNPYMSASAFWKCIEAQRNLYGNAYAWPEIITTGRNAGKIKAIYPIDANHVQILVDDVGLLSSKNSVWYIVTDKLGNQYKLRNDEILHFKGLTLDGIVGIAPLEYLRSLVENGRASQEFINKFFRNGLSIKGVIQYTGDMSPDAERIFRDKFEQMSSGLANAHRVSLMPIGYQFQPISLSMTDAQFLENTQLTIRQIAAVFGIKMHQINDLSAATYNNHEQQQLEYYTDTVMPILTEYEQELTYKLFLTEELEIGYYVKFNVDSILRADQKTRYESYQKAIQSGWIRVNEVREKEDMEPDPDGEKLIVNGNMMPLAMAGEQYKRDKGGESTNGNNQE